jgi:hypothetical protein
MSTILDALRRAQESGAEPDAGDPGPALPRGGDEPSGPGGGDGGGREKKSPSALAVVMVAVVGLGIGGLAARYLLPGAEEPRVVEPVQSAKSVARAGGDKGAAPGEHVPERQRERRKVAADKSARPPRSSNPFKVPKGMRSKEASAVAAGTEGARAANDAETAAAPAMPGQEGGPRASAPASDEKKAATSDAEASAGVGSAAGSATESAAKEAAPVPGAVLAKVESAMARPATREKASAAPSTMPGGRTRRGGVRKVPKGEERPAAVKPASEASPRPFAPRPPSAGALGAPVPGAAEATAPAEPGTPADAVASAKPDAPEVLDSAPSDAPEVDLLFIQWSRAPEKRVASLRGEGGRLVVVHEGDLVDGMRVAAIRPDAIEFVWHGSQFQVIAGRY